ncbi:hypothetical protein [Phreatobacter stygius]|uniref:Uncharacterized protein n=1 Tax=Phreatobacter stygius TaxID=1940610 RepID=A0A4D7BCV9_9HYPH|nr:hypothetical protein [Phreatobacter stygius]QCI68525.1 hypothetical protein E8M01_32435 [Phreatobacter stygius]
MSGAPMTNPASTPGQDPDRPAADDLGKMWPGQGSEADRPAGGQGAGAEQDQKAPDAPQAPDPRERKELGQAVADLDNPPAETEGNRGLPDANPVTGSRP